PIEEGERHRAPAVRGRRITREHGPLPHALGKRLAGRIERAVRRGVGQEDALKADAARHPGGIALDHDVEAHHRVRAAAHHADAAPEQ
ncbi:hypothetical protein DKX15_18335, partial [Enterococcus faecium]